MIEKKSKGYCASPILTNAKHVLPSSILLNTHCDTTPIQSVSSDVKPDSIINQQNPLNYSLRYKQWKPGQNDAENKYTDW